MKTLITTIALSSVLAATNAAAGNNVQIDLYSTGISVQSGAYYSSKEQVVTDRANLPEHLLGAEIFVGSK